MGGSPWKGRVRPRGVDSSSFERSANPEQAKGFPFAVPHSRIDTKGIVLTEFLEMVEEGHGLDIVDELLDLPNLSHGGSYTSVGTYEFAELASLVAKLSSLLEVPTDELLRAYGVHLFGRFSALFVIQ